MTVRARVGCLNGKTRLYMKNALNERGEHDQVIDTEGRRRRLCFCPPVGKEVRR
jgi:hypothetical protein